MNKYEMTASTAPSGDPAEQQHTDGAALPCWDSKITAAGINQTHLRGGSGSLDCSIFAVVFLLVLQPIQQPAC